ncbi:MAG: MSMEG_4193 family putative phosphomutase [Actinomycetota bacterium]|nr:MSMEG_4193 family putative phosphomutase [Actinomycetota bacterium]
MVLLRHARSTANAKGVLAGRSEGVELDEGGVTQAEALVHRLAEVPIARLVSSPVLRCLRTLAPLAGARGLPIEQDEGLAEVDYGDWTGRPLSGLGGEPLWRTVQAHPSAVVFPGGEGLAAVAARAVATVRRLADSTEGDSALLICSHGDVIKSILADALGMHLDQFQRISVGPASISVVRYTEHRPFVELLGETGSLAGIVPSPAPDTDSSTATSSDAVPGGATGVLPAVTSDAVTSTAAPSGSEPARPALS